MSKTVDELSPFVSETQSIVHENHHFVDEPSTIADEIRHFVPETPHFVDEKSENGDTSDGNATLAPLSTRPPAEAMKKTKAIVDFTDYKASEFGAIARTIQKKLEENAPAFPQPPLAVATLHTLVEEYATRLVARASRATADVIALRAKRRELESALRSLGHYVNLVAKGDALVVERSGFPVYTTGAPIDPAPPAAPTDLRLVRGILSGTAVARYRAISPTRPNEVETTTGDPNDESAWTRYGIFPRGRAELSGFAPGALLWVRVRTLGLKGVMGPWSDPAQVRLG
jgi:hypothetical protein